MALGMHPFSSMRAFTLRLFLLLSICTALFALPAFATSSLSPNCLSLLEKLRSGFIRTLQLRDYKKGKLPKWTTFYTRPADLTAGRLVYAMKGDSETWMTALENQGEAGFPMAFTSSGTLKFHAEVEVGIWEALDANGKVIGSSEIYTGTLDSISSDAVLSGFLQLVNRMVDSGELQDISAFRDRHTHPRYVNSLYRTVPDEFSSQDQRGALALKSLIENIMESNGLQSVDLYREIIYTKGGETFTKGFKLDKNHSLKNGDYAIDKTIAKDLRKITTENE